MGVRTSKGRSAHVPSLSGTYATNVIAKLSKIPCLVVDHGFAFRAICAVAISVTFAIYADRFDPLNHPTVLVSRKSSRLVPMDMLKLPIPLVANITAIAWIADFFRSKVASFHPTVEIHSFHPKIPPVQTHPIHIPKWISGDEAAGAGVVPAGAEVEESEVGVVLAAGVRVAVGVSAGRTNGATGVVDAERAVGGVGVALDQRTGGVGEADDGILLVAMVARI